jgi:hypothetical protein
LVKLETINNDTSPQRDQDVVVVKCKNNNDDSKNNKNDDDDDEIHVLNPSILRSKDSKKKIVAKCLDAKQIDLDIGRCTWHLLNGSQRSRIRQMHNKHRKKISTLLKWKQRRLGNFINLVLIQSYANSIFDGKRSRMGDNNDNGEYDYCDIMLDERLRYYQGYHDVSCIFLSALGGVSKPCTDSFPSSTVGDKKKNLSKPIEQAITASKTASTLGLELPCKVLLQISQSHLKDCLKPNFESLTTALRLVVMPLIHHFDPEVHDHLTMCGMEPFFCLSWIISWFSHDVRDTSLVKRLFDVFIVSHQLMPIYMSIAMVLHPYNREEILSTECEFASVHKILA